MSIQTRRILLMNSNNSIKEMMKLCLETIPYCEVITVNLGIEGIEKASAEEICAILLDIEETMPDISIGEIVRDLKQNPLTQGIPLILLTSTLQSSELLQLKQIGEIQAIAKSFDLLNIASQISVLLNWN